VGEGVVLLWWGISVVVDARFGRRSASGEEESGEILLPRGRSPPEGMLRCGLGFFVGRIA